MLIPVLRDPRREIYRFVAILAITFTYSTKKRKTQIFSFIFGESQSLYRVIRDYIQPKFECRSNKPYKLRVRFSLSSDCRCHKQNHNHATNTCLISTIHTIFKQRQTHKHSQHGSKTTIMCGSINRKYLKLIIMYTRRC